MNLSIKNIQNESYLESLVDFQLKMASETENMQLDREILTKGIRAVLNDPSKGKYYLAMMEDRVLGMLLTINEWSDWRCKNVLWIHSVYIVPEFRSQGIFKKMYHHLKTIVLENSQEYAGLRLYVDKTNTNASQVYEKLGMTKEHYDLYEWLN